MSEHLTPRTMERYSQRVLLPLELIETDAHLASCAVCRQLLSEKEGTGAAINYFRAGLRGQATEEMEHPTPAQLVAYADRQMDEVDREVMDGHLLVCAECPELLRDLNGFMKTPVAAPITEALPLPMKERASASPPSLRERFVAFWNAHASWASPRTVGVMATLLLLVGIAALIWYSLRERPQAGSPQVAQVSPTPVPTASPQPTIEATPSPAIEGTGPNVNRPKATAPPKTSATPATPTTTSLPAVALRDGNRVTIDNRGQVKGLEALSTPERRAVESALKTQRVEAPVVLAAVAGDVETLRGGNGQGVAFPVLGPIGTAVMSERPTLRWGALSGASSYVVTIYDRNFVKVAASEPLASTHWTVSRPLERGKVYSWHVVAFREGQEVTSPEQPAPEAKFIIIEQTKAEELERALELYKDSRLTRGTLYARAGLMDEAEGEFQAFLSQHPRSTVAHNLLRSLRALRGFRR